MSDTTSAPTREEFAQWLHDALNQLYDSPYLQTHPLAQLLAEPGMDTLQRDQHLRRVLINAIEQLRPQAGIPAQSPKWRAFQLLELRYIEGLSAAEIMRELALSRSTYFREQARTMDALTAALWEQWQQRTTTSLELAIAGASREQLAQAEVERLSAHATWEVTDVTALLQTLRPIAEPLARSRGAALSITMPPRLSAPRADRVLLRQTLLNIITYALDVVPAGQHARHGLRHWRCPPARCRPGGLPPVDDGNGWRIADREQREHLAGAAGLGDCAAACVAGC
jgi:hypothetical protein